MPIIIPLKKASNPYIKSPLLIAGIAQPESIPWKNKFTDCKIKFIILIANEKEILKRDALRPENCQMKKRCIELLESFKRKNFTEKFYLDTSNLTIEETVQAIENNDEYLV